MIKYIALYTFLSTVFIFNASAQKKPLPKQKPSFLKGTVFFDQTTHDFGMIEEKQGNVRTRFAFTNIGKAPVSIKRVEVTCGCTVPEWPKEAVKPGEKAYIDVEFDPLNKVGQVSKTLTVSTDGDPEFLYLTINGEVYREGIDLLQTFPFAQGNMRFSKYNLQFRPMFENATDSITFTVMNTSKKDMSIIRVVAPSHIQSRVVHSMLTPGNVTDITLIFKAPLLNDLGPRTDEVFIYTTDDTLVKKIVSVKSEVQQNFNLWPEAMKKNPPKLKWKDAVHDYGEVYTGEKLTYEFEVTNTGKTDLLIKKTAPSCGCTVSTFSKDPIKKGKTGKIKVVLNAADLRGQIEKTITVYTNDPANSVNVLKVKAKVIIPGVDPILGGH